MALNFPHARSVVGVRSQRTEKRPQKTTQETRYHVSCLDPEEWHGLIRGHWAGVENRDHWRRDALFGEDRSRSRNTNLLTNLALLRNALLAVLSRCLKGGSVPVIRTFFNERIEIARAVEDAEDFDTGSAGQFAVENEVVGEFRDDPDPDVLMAAKPPHTAQGGIAGQEIEAVENGLLDAIRRLGVVGSDVGVNNVHIRHGLFGKDELSHGRDGGQRRVGASLSGRHHRGCPCPHRVP